MHSFRVLVSTLAVAGGLHAAIGVAQTAAPQDDRGSLEWYARQAKQSGKAAITLPRRDILVAETEPLSETLLHTSGLVAQLVASAVTHDDYEIVTWRKYRILEVLSVQQRGVPREPLPDIVPSKLLPVASDEFVLPEPGGTVTIDGVNITLPGPEGNIPVDQSRRLMFVLLRSGGALAMPNYGPRGVFWVDNVDGIHARVESEGDPLQSDLADRVRGKLSELRVFATGSITPNRSLTNR